MAGRVCLLVAAKELMTGIRKFSLKCDREEDENVSLTMSLHVVHVVPIKAAMFCKVTQIFINLGRALNDDGACTFLHHHHHHHHHHHNHI